MFYPYTDLLLSLHFVHIACRILCVTYVRVSLFYTPHSTFHYRFLAVDVQVNHCLDSIVAGGVQISGLHATVAPRRQQQIPPTLEEFVFVPYVETECLSANEKITEKLRLCKGNTKKLFYMVVYLHTLV